MVTLNNKLNKTQKRWKLFKIAGSFKLRLKTQASIGIEAKNLRDYTA